MNWPPQGPDLNIIEAVWDHLDRERHRRQPKSTSLINKIVFPSRDFLRKATLHLLLYESWAEPALIKSIFSLYQKKGVSFAWVSCGFFVDFVNTSGFRCSPSGNQLLVP